MSAHKATIAWRRSSDDFDYERYNRSHEWSLAGVSLPASAAPEFLGDSDRVDPEEAFVASLSACHMLTFLAIASREGYVVDSYTDEATGILAHPEDKRLVMTRVTLRPRIEFGGDKQPDQAAMDRMHELSHRECFLANSVNTEIIVEAPVAG